MMYVLAVRLACLFLHQLLFGPFGPWNYYHRAGTTCSILLEMSGKLMGISPSCKPEDHMAR